MSFIKKSVSAHPWRSLRLSGEVSVARKSTAETQRTPRVRRELKLVNHGLLIILLLSFSWANGQTVTDPKLPSSSTETAPARETVGQESKEASKTPPLEEKSTVTIFLAQGGPIVVDEVAESNDGFWYKRGNVTTFLERARVERIEYPKPPGPIVATEAVEGTGKWKIADAARVEAFFVTRFKRSLPLTAFGQSDLHTRWGLDHRNGMDVGLHPDSVEGRALIEFLRTETIPFLAFRGPIPGVATGPHIHIGNRSSRFHGH